MKILKYIFALFISASVILAFTSCNDDGYSLDDFTVALATVNSVGAESDGYFLTLDDGTTLWPAASNGVYVPEVGERVIVNYTVLSDKQGQYDHFVKINGMQEILTKDVVDLTAENKDEIGNDPIKILDLWTGDNFLNIHFRINIGGSKTHTINLVRNKLNVADGDEAIELEFRHNKNGDEEKYRLNNYAAFNLRSLQVAGRDSIKLIIKVQDYDNEVKTYPVTYKYNSTLLNKQNKYITDMPETHYQIR